MFQVKNGFSLDNANHVNEDDHTRALQAFVQSTKIIQSQKGFIRQYWGHQVEDISVFAWSIDWESQLHHATFNKSHDHDILVTGLSQFFDFSKGPPLTIFTHWTTDATAAFEAPVTEVAFMTLPDESGEEPKTEIEEALVPIMRDVKTVGKSWGAAIGWVSEVGSKDHAGAPQGQTLSLHGVFGYASVEDHMRWRETPEHAKAIEIMTRCANDLGLGSSTAGGREMFHVRFQSEI